MNNLIKILSLLNQLVQTKTINLVLMAIIVIAIAWIVSVLLKIQRTKVWAILIGQNFLSYSLTKKSTKKMKYSIKLLTLLIVLIKTSVINLMLIVLIIYLVGHYLKKKG